MSSHYDFFDDPDSFQDDNNESSFCSFPESSYQIKEGPPIQENSSSVVYICRYIPSDESGRPLSKEKCAKINENEAFCKIFKHVRCGCAGDLHGALWKLYQKSSMATFAIIEWAMVDVPKSTPSYIWEQAFLAIYSQCDLSQGDQCGEYRFNVSWDRAVQLVKQFQEKIEGKYAHKSTFRRGFMDARFANTKSDYSNAKSTIHDNDASIFYVLEHTFPSDQVQKVTQDVPEFGRVISVMKPGITSLKNKAGELVFKRFTHFFAMLPLDCINISFIVMRSSNLLENEIKSEFKKRGCYSFGDKPLREWMRIIPGKSTLDIVSDYAEAFISSNHGLQLSDGEYHLNSSIIERLKVAHQWDAFQPNKMIHLPNFKRQTVGSTISSCLLIWCLNHGFIKSKQLGKIIDFWVKHSTRNLLTYPKDIALFIRPSFRTAPIQIQLQHTERDESRAIERIVMQDIRRLYSNISDTIDTSNDFVSKEVKMQLISEQSKLGIIINPNRRLSYANLCLLRFIQWRQNETNRILTLRQENVNDSGLGKHRLDASKKRLEKQKTQTKRGTVSQKPRNECWNDSDDDTIV